MPLPNPTYLTAEPYNWDGFTTPAALLTNPRDATTLGSNISIRWDACDAYDRIMIHDLIMGYASRNALAETVALTLGPAKAYQVVNYGGTIVAGNLAGLVTGEEYKASIVVNGTEYPILITGVASDTVADVITKINAQILAGATISATTDIELSSIAAGAGEIVEIFDQNLFSSINPGTFVELEEIRVGVNDITGVFDLNFRNKYQSYADLLIGKLRNVLNKTVRSAKTVNDEYFNHGSLTWLNLITDL